MKYLLFGDTHFSTKPHAKERLKVFDIACAIVKDRDIDTVIHMGDICDNKDCHSAELVNPIVAGFRRLSETAKNGVFIIQGNHDHAFNDERISRGFFSFLTNLPKVEYVCEPRKIDDNVAVYPHNTMANDDFTPVEKSRIVMTHECFLGATSNAGVALQHGDDLKKLYKHGLPGAKFFSGDIHKAQFVDELYYVGAPYHTNFADDYDGQLVVLEVTVDDIRMERVSTDGMFPKLRKYRLNVADIDENDSCALITGDKDDYYAIDLLFMPDDIGKVNNIRNNIAETAKKAGLKIHAIATYNMQVEQASARVEDRAADNDFSLNESGAQPLAVFDEFCGKRDITGDLRDWGRKQVLNL